MRTKRTRKPPPPKRYISRKPPFRVSKLLQWADAHFKRTGRWPIAKSGEIPEALWDTWMMVNKALKRGQRGMRPEGSLAAFLYKHRGKRWRNHEPRLSIAQILAWADAYHARTGRWPAQVSGAIPEAPGEKWANVNAALMNGGRGLPGGDSLTRLLIQRRGVRSKGYLPKVTKKQILAWAEHYYAQYGHWPYYKSGPVPEMPGETWSAVSNALWVGLRGLPGGDTLAQLLARERGYRHSYNRPRLTYGMILSWCDLHHKQTGDWPKGKSGRVLGAPGETWTGIDLALLRGTRGLPGGSSIAKLLAKYRGRRSKAHTPPLTPSRIVAWAREHHRRTGRWPAAHSGPVHAANGEKWNAIDAALRVGMRGLPGGSSVSRLLDERVGRNRKLKAIAAASDRAARRPRPARLMRGRS